MTAGSRYTDLRPGVLAQDENPFRREAGYISLRWRLLLPLFAVVLAFAMIAAYLITSAVTRGGQATQTQQLMLSAYSAAAGMQAFHNDQVREAMRIAYTEGIGQAVASRDVETLRRRLEADAAAANLDAAVLLDASGVEVVGLLRASSTGWSPYAASTGADLGGLPLIQTLQQEGHPGDASALMRTPQGLVVYTAVPLPNGEGLALAGTRLERVLQLLRSSGLAQAAFYDGEARLAQATFDPRGGLYDSLAIAPEVFGQALAASNGQTLTDDLDLAGYPYQAAYLPFVVGRDPLGVLAVFLPSHLLYATDLSRQLISLLMASLVGSLVIGGYAAVGRTLARIRRVTETAQALAQGDITARTKMRVLDEVGELGRSLDVYADRTWKRQESLQASLRRQRRENARLTAILESIPDGVVVQDLDGRVLMINDAARRLLGSQRVFRSSFNELTAAATDALGPALAPGLYALGQPQRVSLGETVLSAQAAAVMTSTGRRVGLVTLLRDITAEVKKEQEREALLQMLSRDVHEPLQSLVTFRPVESVAALQDFAREVKNNAIRLQRLIADLRDLADLGPDQVRGGQRPLSVEDLLNAAAAEWGPAAQAADLSLQVMALQRDLHVLGDERRLRWALGNLIDNAIKFTLPGGQVRLVVRQRASEGKAELIVEDTGVGVRPEDQPHLFTRFFRGVPLTPGGSVLRVPGMGQGLFIARRVIEAHGGAITLESVPLKGTRVTCVLPLTAPVTMQVQETTAPVAHERVPAAGEKR